MRTLSLFILLLSSLAGFAQDPGQVQRLIKMLTDPSASLTLQKSELKELLQQMTAKKTPLEASLNDSLVRTLLTLLQEKKVSLAPLREESLRLLTFLEIKSGWPELRELFVQEERLEEKLLLIELHQKQKKLSSLRPWELILEERSATVANALSKLCFGPAVYSPLQLSQLLPKLKEGPAKEMIASCLLQSGAQEGLDYFRQRAKNHDLKNFFYLSQGVSTVAARQKVLSALREKDLSIKEAEALSFVLSPYASEKEVQDFIHEMLAAPKIMPTRKLHALLISRLDQTQIPWDFWQKNMSPALSSKMKQKMEASDHRGSLSPFFYRELQGLIALREKKASGLAENLAFSLQELCARIQHLEASTPSSKKFKNELLTLLKEEKASPRLTELLEELLGEAAPLSATAPSLSPFAGKDDFKSAEGMEFWALRSLFLLKRA